MNENPTGMTANKKTKEFTVTWNDNHTSVYPFELLRAACPCASCRGGHDWQLYFGGKRLVEAAGIEPASEKAYPEKPTCVSMF